MSIVDPSAGRVLTSVLAPPPGHRPSLQNPPGHRPGLQNPPGHRAGPTGHRNGPTKSGAPSRSSIAPTLQLRAQLGNQPVTLPRDLLQFRTHGREPRRLTQTFFRARLSGPERIVQKFARALQPDNHTTAQIDGRRPLAAIEPTRQLSITMLGRIMKFWLKILTATGTASDPPNQPRLDRVQHLLPRNTRSFF